MKQGADPGLNMSSLNSSSNSAFENNRNPLLLTPHDFTKLHLNEKLPTATYGTFMEERMSPLYRRQSCF